MMNQEADEFCMSPVGFIFKPTDTELLSILEAKILEPTSYGFVPECKGLYDGEPWRIFGEPAGNSWKMKNHYYVFTTLKKMGNSKSKFYRRVGHGGGTWKGNKVKDVKNDRGVVVGTVRNFTFVPTKKGAATAAGRWIMDEFSIPQMSKDYMICKIKSITKDMGENLIANQDCGYNVDHEDSRVAAPSWSSPQQYLQQVQCYDHMPDAYDHDGNHMLSDTPHDTENMGGVDSGHECSYTINHGDHMISSIPTSSSSSSSSLPLTHPVTGDDDIDQLLSSFSTQYDMQQADQYDHIMFDIDHLLSDILLPTEDINGAEGHETVYYNDHRVSSISLPPSTLFNDEQMIPSFPPHQGQHDDHLFRDILVAEGDKVYKCMSQPLLECSTSQQQAGAPSSSPLDELLLSFPSTQQVQHDHMEYDLDEHLSNDVHLSDDIPPAANIRGNDQCQPLEPSFQPVGHDENKSSPWDLEAFSALVASQDVNPLIPCCFTDIVSSPTPVHGVNFDDLWT